MKLSKDKMLLVSFMLFSLFFGAGNLIFPPFLGQNAGTESIPALVGFLLTAVVLPVLGVVVVAKFNGLDALANNVGKKFSFVFTILIYLSIGPGLGIPRAASVPFEMAVAPYLPEGVNTTLFMVLYSAVFFLVALWLCMNPGKLVKRIGRFLTPSLLVLLFLLFVSFLFNGKVDVTAPQEAYQAAPFFTGFVEGYNTMDTIAALNFGLVIAVTLNSFGLKEKKSVMRYTVLAGVFAGSILALVYVMLTYMGMSSSGVYALQDNGALILRHIVYQLFGEFGAIILATIFTLACLTTSVGLINSISEFFSNQFKFFSYKQWVYVIVGFSFLVCNLGLNMILSLSLPVLNAIYPVSITLILLGLSHKFWKSNRFTYPLVIAGVAVESVLHAFDQAGVTFGVVSKFCHSLPLYQEGFAWVAVAVVMLALSFVANALVKAKSPSYQKAQN